MPAGLARPGEDARDPARPAGLRKSVDLSVPERMISPTTGMDSFQNE